MCFHVKPNLSAPDLRFFYASTYRVAGKAALSFGHPADKLIIAPHFFRLQTSHHISHLNFLNLNPSTAESETPGPDLSMHEFLERVLLESPIVNRKNN